jgi:hypothetical protein
MTRHTWTAPEQNDWLESQKAAFLEAKQKGKFRQSQKTKSPKRSPVDMPQKINVINTTKYAFIHS